MGDRDKARPIYSTRADDPACGDALEAFAVGLAERVDHLQDVEICCDFAQLASLAEVLADDARELGYGSLAGAARSVVAAARSERSDDARARLLHVTELAHRIRLGHRGAF
jgi:hypothetical protein